MKICVAVEIINKTISLKRQALKKKTQGFPGGSVVKNPPANAGDTGLIPDLERSRGPQLLSLCSEAHELELLKPVCPRACALQQEEPL